MLPIYIIDVIRFLVGTGILTFAAISDLRTRTVEDNHWLIMGIAGMGINIVYAVLYTPDKIIATAGALSPFMLLIFFMYCDYLYDKEKGMNWPHLGLLITSSLIFVYVFLYGSWDAKLLVYPYVMIWIFYGMYYMYLISGGADAKALMTIAILVPMRPVTIGSDFFSNILTLAPVTIFIIHPSISVLMNAALITILLPVFWFLYNIARGDVSLKGFLGIRMDIDKAMEAKVWPMEYIDEEGHKKTVLFPTKWYEDEDSVMKVYRRMKEIGMKKIWVTPKIPMIVSILIGFVLYFWLGNLFMKLLYP